MYSVALHTLSRLVTHSYLVAWELFLRLAAGGGDGPRLSGRREAREAGTCSPGPTSGPACPRPAPPRPGGQGSRGNETGSPVRRKLTAASAFFQGRQVSAEVWGSGHRSEIYLSERLSLPRWKIQERSRPPHHAVRDEASHEDPPRSGVWFPRLRVAHI